jgi:hypothetical protein
VLKLYAGSGRVSLADVGHITLDDSTASLEQHAEGTSPSLAGVSN